ncbi:2'-5' RNA ligase family protein [Actinoplanes sp. CA-030573]|uniref:2'-5' RNA ligase family protein n=1 Tax=Actinoplanes sp. CA-030573 TaxID=3239898 RepID=UPI003D89CAA4
MRTVELLLDQELEEGVREWWRRLRDAGLPSLATHRHPTNRPHLTVVTASSLAGLPPLDLPLAAELGPVRALGRALVREVVATPDLRELQARVWRSLPAPASCIPSSSRAVRSGEPWPAPADWVPHVSLALRASPAQQRAALEMAADLPPAYGRFDAARSYDTVTRTVTDL